MVLLRCKIILYEVTLFHLCRQWHMNTHIYLMLTHKICFSVAFWGILRLFCLFSVLISSPLSIAPHFSIFYLFLYSLCSFYILLIHPGILSSSLPVRIFSTSLTSIYKSLGKLIQNWSLHLFIPHKLHCCTY